MAKILVVDDEVSIVESIKYNLEREGFRTITAADGEEALQVFEMERPDLIILDLMLPKLGGEAVCKHIRRESEIPIIMLSAKGEEVDRVVGLEIGADDYMTKPFSMRELMARVKSVLKRTGAKSDAAPESLIAVAPFELDKKRHEIRLRGKALRLTLKEFELLELLMINAGQVLTRDVLLSRVWGDDYFGDAKTLDVHIRRLRKKMEADPSNPVFLKTVRGVGYRLEVGNEN
jgi:DNA-binding response OmpR family regulator